MCCREDSLCWFSFYVSVLSDFQSFTPKIFLGFFVQGKKAQLNQYF